MATRAVGAVANVGGGGGGARRGREGVGGETTQRDQAKHSGQTEEVNVRAVRKRDVRAQIQRKAAARQEM